MRAGGLTGRCSGDAKLTGGGKVLERVVNSQKTQIHHHVLGRLKPKILVLVVDGFFERSVVIFHKLGVWGQEFLHKRTGNERGIGGMREGPWRWGVERQGESGWNNNKRSRIEFGCATKHTRNTNSNWKRKTINWSRQVWILSRHHRQIVPTLSVNLSADAITSSAPSSRPAPPPTPTSKAKHISTRITNSHTRTTNKPSKSVLIFLNKSWMMRLRKTPIKLITIGISIECKRIDVSASPETSTYKSSSTVEYVAAEIEEIEDSWSPTENCRTSWMERK